MADLYICSDCDPSPTFRSVASFVYHVEAYHPEEVS
jgi:hypothetical protein